ncbi:MAG: endonuclease MutS2 [Lachnospiraceae bacterium]|nr:endonuclease MutS2 [Lachnospiraceae bacterium]
MKEKHLRKLEFDKILFRLAEKAASDAAKEQCMKLQPSDNIFEVQRWQDETDEAFRYCIAKGSPSFLGLRDIRGSVKRTALGAELTMKELLDIAACLHSVSHLKEYGKREKGFTGDFPQLDPRFDGLHVVKQLELEIEHCILSEEEMNDDASPALKKIRKEILLQENRIQSQLQNMVHSEAYKNMLQDQIVTMRGGRYCLPVKSEFRNGITGMVHDQSSSGSTLFVEPMAVVQMNNAIAQLKVDEAEEIHRILKKLSGMVDQEHVVILADQAILTELDFIFAKGALALEMNGVKPELNERGIIDLPGARHPLLDPAKVVPIDVHLGEGFRSLVITGPNTGGKTVTLKTLGLLQIMGQAGLHVPAKSAAKITILDQVFADIGDEQSIEQSLSTFSSHMVNIVEILKEVTPWSLALFDELGAGTDPTEGAALAQSIIEDLRKRRVLTAATTHYSELKVYALSTESVENASCEFNVETLMPTYRLMIGVPGRSNAFAISKRLGIPEDIIQEAQQLLEAEDVRFEDMITDLEMKRIEVEKEQEQIEKLRSELSALRSGVSSEKQKLEKQRESIISKAKEEAKTIVRQAKAEADASITKMNKIIQKGGSVDMRALEQERTKLRTTLNTMNEEAQEEKRPKGKAVTEAELIPGTLVLLKGFDQPYSVLRRPDNRHRLEVQAGIMKMQIKVEDIEAILDDADAAPAKDNRKERVRSSQDTIKSAGFHPELDLRGLMTDEGVDELDKYLDDAYLSGIDQVRIIHGKGTGAMRNAVHHYLKKALHVKSFRLGVYGEGDSGVTVVELKK